MGCRTKERACPGTSLRAPRPRRSTPRGESPPVLPRAPTGRSHLSRASPSPPALMESLEEVGARCLSLWRFLLDTLAHSFSPHRSAVSLDAFSSPDTACSPLAHSVVLVVCVCVYVFLRQLLPLRPLPPLLHGQRWVPQPLFSPSGLQVCPQA